MPLLFPIAPSPREALDTEGGARTVAEARELARGPVALVTDWLRPQPSEREALQGKADAGVARGFVQLYEDAKGQPVIAVTYWKPGAEPAPPLLPPRHAAPEKNEAAEDHTDDLYFAKAGARGKRKRKAGDPNQMDLFGGGQKSGLGTGPRVDTVEEDTDPSPNAE
jgi:hypothetical protein